MRSASFSEMKHIVYSVWLALL